MCVDTLPQNVGFGLDCLLTVLERVEAYLVVIQDDPLVAKELCDLCIRLAPILRTTFTLDELNIELTGKCLTKVAINLQLFSFDTEELFLINIGEVSGVWARFKESDIATFIIV